MVQNSTNNKLAGFEFFRFFFMIWICLIHIWTPFRICHGGIGVDFFFISAGFFLFKGFEKAQLSVFHYSRKRFFRLFPVYIIGVILGYIISIFDHIKDGATISPFGVAESFFTESLMIQDTGWFTHLTLGNPVSWYVSVLFIGSILLYAALRFNSSLTINILIPLFCLGYYTLYAHANYSDITFFDQAIGPVFLPLGRGVAGLALGILIAKASPALSNCSIREKTFLHLLALVSLVLVIAYILFIEENHDTLAIFIFVIIVTSCSIPDSWFNRIFNHNIWIFCGSITYEMLMMQIPCRYLINFGFSFFPHHRNLWVLAYLLLTIISAYLVKIVLTRLLPKLAR